MLNVYRDRRLRDVLALRRLGDAARFINRNEGTNFTNIEHRSLYFSRLDNCEQVSHLAGKLPIALTPLRERCARAT